MKQRPKLKIVYSTAYAKTIYKLLNDSKTDFEGFRRQIKERGAAFEDCLNTRQARILELIPAHTGYDWDEFAEPVIYVYPVAGIASFSHPLTLSVKENPVVTLGVFIHELLHNNMNFVFPSAEIQERIISTVACLILRDLGFDDARYHELAAEIFQNRFTRRFILVDELTKNTVKNYLEKNAPAT